MEENAKKNGSVKKGRKKALKNGQKNKNQGKNAEKLPKKGAKSLESRRKCFPSAKKLRIGKNHQKVEKKFSICHLCANN